MCIRDRIISTERWHLATYGIYGWKKLFVDSIAKLEPYNYYWLVVLANGSSSVNYVEESGYKIVVASGSFSDFPNTFPSDETVYSDRKLAIYARCYKIGASIILIGHEGASAGKSCKIYVKYQDDYGLDTSIISLNNTGQWVNHTQNLSGNIAWHNMTFTLNSSANVIVYYKVYVKNIIGEWIESLSYKIYVLWSHFNPDYLNIIGTGYSTTGSPNLPIGHSLGRKFLGSRKILAICRSIC